MTRRFVIAVAGALLALGGALTVSACIPYHPQHGQEPYVYSPVPGGNH